MTSLEFFDYYRQLDWQIIPVRPRSKQPLFSGWNKVYDPTLARKTLIDCPSFNLGLLLGEIVDVEADNSEANERLISWTDVPHPCYRSEKSIHHLFLSPHPHLTRVIIKGIEFRGHKHQSLVPPSINAHGVPYQWLRNSVFRIPPMPKDLLQFYRQGCQRASAPDQESMFCPQCQQKVMMHQERLHLERMAFLTLGQIWMCRRCRNIDMRPLCRKMRKTSK